MIGGIEMPCKYHIYADKRQKRKIRALAFPIKKNENIYLLKYVGLYPGGLISGGAYNRGAYNRDEKFVSDLVGL